MEEQKDLLSEFNLDVNLEYNYTIKTKKIRVASIITLVYLIIIYAYTGEDSLINNIFEALKVIPFGFALISAVLGSIVAIFLTKKQLYKNRFGRVFWIIMFCLATICSIAFSVNLIILLVFKY